MKNKLPVEARDPEILGMISRAQSLLKKRALIAAAAAAVPVPGLDWAVDAALLARMVPAINKEFGLTPKQIEGLDVHSRSQVHKAVALVGSALIGRLMTREALLVALRVVGVRAGAGRLARYAPVVGQALSAVAGYAAIQYFGARHIEDCARVVGLAREALIVPSAPAPKKKSRRESGVL